MRRWIALVVSFLFASDLSIWARATWYRPLLADAPLPTSAVENPPSQAARPKVFLPARVKWVRFEVLLGRFSVITNRYGHNHVDTGEENTGVHESFTVSSDSPFATVRYEASSTTEHFLVEHIPNRVTLIQREPVGDVSLKFVQFSQDCYGTTRLVVGTGEDATKIRATSLWHILIREPELCERELIPLLERLRPGWKLLENAKHIEDAMLAKSADPCLETRKLDRLLDDLKSPQFHRRQAADRDIRSLGLAALPYLSRIRPSQLNTEQRARVKEIIDSYDIQTGDTVERVTCWLIEDQSVWVSLLGQRDLAKRTSAYQHLCRVSAVPVRFDPEASAEIRRQQIDSLSPKFASK